MKRLLFLIALVPLATLGQNLGKLSEKNGYRDYIFGTAPTQYKNLTLEIEEGSTQLYSLSACPVSMDGAEFAYVRITFLKNRLSAIALQTKNSTGSKFLALLKENYGEPVKKNKANYEWKSDKVQLLYEKNGNDEDATISFFSNEIYRSAK